MNIDTYIFQGISNSASLAVGDFAVANGKLSCSGVPTVKLTDIENYVIRVAVAETLGIWTTTPTAAASKNFNLLVEQFRPDLGFTVQRVLTYASKADGTDTATTICNAWRTALLAFPELKMAGTGTTTLILTATAGYAGFRVTSVGDGTAAAVNGTPAVPARNTFQALTDKGITGQVAGGSYTSVECIYRTTGTSENIGGTTSMGRNRWTIFINQAATNYAAILVRLVEHANGVIAGQSAGGTANPENPAIGDATTT